MNALIDPVTERLLEEIEERSKTWDIYECPGDGNIVPIFDESYRYHFRLACRGMPDEWKEWYAGKRPSIDDGQGTVLHAPGFSTIFSDGAHAKELVEMGMPPLSYGYWRRVEGKHGYYEGTFFNRARAADPDLMPDNGEEPSTDQDELIRRQKRAVYELSKDWKADIGRRQKLCKLPPGWMNYREVDEDELKQMVKQHKNARR